MVLIPKDYRQDTGAEETERFGIKSTSATLVLAVPTTKGKQSSCSHLWHRAADAVLADGGVIAITIDKRCSAANAGNPDAIAASGEAC